MLRLTEAQTEELLTQPESGMGFQLVEFRSEGYGELALVLNAELLAFPREFGDLRRYDDYETALESTERSASGAIISLQDTADRPEEELSYIAEGPPPPLVVKSAVSRTTSSFEGFKRFSAFKRDRRMTGGMRANSYTTSVNDSRLVPSGYSAVGRYALPSPWPASYVYTIVPATSTTIVTGTVVPAFGQAGGGVEALFLRAVTKDETCGPYRLPEI